jgi:hypothetical protein
LDLRRCPYVGLCIRWDRGGSYVELK